jgi:methionyl-tRNA formyltransferase
MMKIYKSEKEINSNNGQTGTPTVAEQAVIPSKPGEFQADGKSVLKFACSDGYILVKELQLEGKKKMNVEDFLRGYRSE